MKWQKNEKVKNEKKKIRMIVGELILKNSWFLIKGTRTFLVNKIKEVMTAKRPGISFSGDETFWN